MHEIASRRFSRFSVPNRPVSSPARNPAPPIIANSTPTVVDPPCSPRSTMNGIATVKHAAAGVEDRHRAGEHPQYSVPPHVTDRRPGVGEHRTGRDRVRLGDDEPDEQHRGDQHDDRRQQECRPWADERHGDARDARTKHGGNDVPPGVGRIRPVP